MVPDELLKPKAPVLMPGILDDIAMANKINKQANKINALQKHVRDLKIQLAQRVPKPRSETDAKTINALQEHVRYLKAQLAERAPVPRSKADAKKINALQEQTRELTTRLDEVSPRKRPRKRKTFSTLSVRQKRRRVNNLILDNVEDSFEDTVVKFQAALKVITPDKNLSWLLKATLKYGAGLLRELIDFALKNVDQTNMPPDNYIALETQIGLTG